LSMAVILEVIEVVGAMFPHAGRVIVRN